MRAVTLAAFAALTFFTATLAAAQSTPKTLVAVFAHADDETAVAPVLARYARKGVSVHMIVVTDGSQGAGRSSIPRGPELARVRADEARCATAALGINPPVLLGFPDAALGHYAADPSRVYRLTQRVHEELQRLHPDAVVTWGQITCSRERSDHVLPTQNPGDN